jgi:hypothetical protein
LLVIDPQTIAKLDSVLAEISQRKREYATPPPFRIPHDSPILRSEFEAVTAAAAAILAAGGRLSVATIAERLHWRSHGRIRTIVHSLRSVGSWRWTLHADHKPISKGPHHAC